MTGGAGFIGSHLVEHLLDRGAAKVVVLDRHAPGSTVSDDRVHSLREDLSSASSTSLESWVRGMDCVFHLAAEKHQSERAFPERLVRTNVVGTQALLSAAARAGVRKVVFASSVYVYGRVAGPPLNEEEPAAPRTLYGISKRTGEMLLDHFTAVHGLESVALRIFFAYGPRQSAAQGYRTVIVKNFERLHNGLDPVVHGDGKQTLDYVYVEDVVRALCLAAECPTEHRILNVGSGAGVSILDLTRRMQQVAATHRQPVQGPADATDGTSRVADIGRIKHALGWRPQVSLEEGLDRTLRWMKDSHR